MRRLLLACPLLALAACASDEPVAPDAPFVVEGVGFGEEFIRAADIDKDIARQVAERCPSGYDVGALEAKRNTGRMTTQQIRYRALVRCRTAPG